MSVYIYKDEDIYVILISFDIHERINFFSFLFTRNLFEKDPSYRIANMSREYLDITSVFISNFIRIRVLYIRIVSE